MATFSYCGCILCGSRAAFNRKIDKKITQSQQLNEHWLICNEVEADCWIVIYWASVHSWVFRALFSVGPFSNLLAEFVALQLAKKIIPQAQRITSQRNQSKRQNYKFFFRNKLLCIFFSKCFTLIFEQKLVAKALANVALRPLKFTVPPNNSKHSKN